MPPTTEISMKDLLKTALASSYSYSEFRTLVNQLTEEEKTTGNDPSEAFVNYTKLNDQRMKRWDKVAKIDPAIKETIQTVASPTTWMVFTESWCGDAGHALPILNKLSELNPNIELRIILRDKHEELMDHFLTNGGRSIPKLVALDTEKNVRYTWGPRPTKATAMVEAHKKEHGKLDSEFKKDLQMWYNKDKGKDIANDIVNLVRNHQ